MSKAMILLQPVLQFFDNNGNVLSGGKLYFYAPNSTTPKNTYTDNTKGVANANPVILDSAGRPDSSGTPINIFLDGSYKLVVNTSADVQVRTVDNFNTLGQLVNTQSVSSTTSISESSRDKLVLVDTSSGSVILNLLASATAGDGFNLKVKKISNDANTVTLDGSGSETIDGATTLVISQYNQTAEIYNNGSAWFTMNPSATAGTPNSYVFYELPINGSNTTTLKAADSLSADNIVVLPTAAVTGTTVATTEPTVQASLNNVPLISSTAGVQSYSIIAMPTAVPTSARQVVVGATSGVLSFSPLSLPAADGTANQVLKTDGAGNLGFAAAATSVVVQQVRTVTGASATGSTAIPIDDTIPQNTEGDQYMSLSITPTSTTTKLVIEVVIRMSAAAAGEMVAALFQDSTASAIAVQSARMSSAAFGVVLSFKHTMTSGTTSATTFKVRAGGDSGTQNTFNGLSGSRLFGGVYASSIMITEYTA